MSIATKTGDAGTTGLMYNRRVRKDDSQVEAYGAVDELNTALGVVRARTRDEFINGNLLAVQKDLVILMGELATRDDDIERYVKDGFQLVAADFVDKLNGLISMVEKDHIRFDGWATPGACELSALLDVARTTCRRAERRVVSFQHSAEHKNAHILVYLNRLSDTLWLLARRVETTPVDV